MATMALPRSLLQYVCSLVFLVACAQALKFDIQAYSQHDRKPERCIRNFVAKDTLVVVTATVDGQRGDGMVVNMHVSTTRNLREFWLSEALLTMLLLNLDQGCCRK